MLQRTTIPPGLLLYSLALVGLMSTEPSTSSLSASREAVLVLLVLVVCQQEAAALCIYIAKVWYVIM